MSSNRAPPPGQAPRILFRDERFVVLDKPAGLPVHPGRRGGPSVEDWFPLLSRRKDGPWLAHRLDADTSGCLVVALRRAALLQAQAAFASGQARKTYWAVVDGHPEGDGGVIEAPIARESTPQGWRMRVDPAGQPAITKWRVRGQTERLAWLELHPRTGRTHQIRVHCRALGCPVLGDFVYADPVHAAPVHSNPVHANRPGRLHLLARAISLPLDPPVHASAEPGAHLIEALRQCGWTTAAA